MRKRPIDHCEQRSETKPLEHRSARESQQCFELKNIELTGTIPVTPTTVRKLLDKGFKVNVERNPVKIFEDEEFKDAGGSMA